MIANTIIIRADLVKVNHQTDMMLGISGMIMLRTMVTQASDGIPKINPVRISTCQALYFGRRAKRLVIHTIPSEYEVAYSG